MLFSNRRAASWIVRLTTTGPSSFAGSPSSYAVM
jgi:hypothetical protein